MYACMYVCTYVRMYVCTYLTHSFTFAIHVFYSCDISHAKSLTAVQVVLEFVGSTVPQLQQTMSGLLEAVHKSQVIPSLFRTYSYA